MVGFTPLRHSEPLFIFLSLTQMLPKTLDESMASLQWWQRKGQERCRRGSIDHKGGKRVREGSGGIDGKGGKRRHKKSFKDYCDILKSQAALSLSFFDYYLK